MSFVPIPYPERNTVNKTKLIIHQTGRLSFSKRLAWLIREVGVDEFYEAASFYGCDFRRERLQRLASIKQRTLKYKAIQFVPPKNLVAMKKAFEQISTTFDVSYALILDGTHKEILCKTSKQLEMTVPDGLDFRSRLVRLRQGKGHPYRGSFVKSLNSMIYRRYAEIEKSTISRPLIRPHEYSEIQRALGCSYSMLIEGIKKDPNQGA